MTDKLDRFIKQKERENADKLKEPRHRLDPRSPLRRLDDVILSPMQPDPPKDRDKMN